MSPQAHNHPILCLRSKPSLFPSRREGEPCTTCKHERTGTHGIHVRECLVYLHNENLVSYLT
jgi:hypothetical protein